MFDRPRECPDVSMADGRSDGVLMRPCSDADKDTGPGPGCDILTPDSYLLLDPDTAWSLVMWHERLISQR